MKADVSHDRIMQLAMGFGASKTLLSAVVIGVFGAFSDGPLGLAALRVRLGLHERAARDFFDALVALGLLQRDHAGRYGNSDEAARFLDPAASGYIGGIIEMFNARLYGFWDSLTEALRTGLPQNEAKRGGDLFAALYTDPDRLVSTFTEARVVRRRKSTYLVNGLSASPDTSLYRFWVLEGFLRAMTGQTLPVAQTLARVFPWETVRTVVDIGTAQGCLPVELARSHAHLSGGDSISPPLLRSSRAMWKHTGYRTDYDSRRAISSPMICLGLTYW